MKHMNIPIEFNVEVPAFPEELRQDIEQSIMDLVRDRRDITGASITLNQPAHGETPYLFRASVVVYMRPENIYADEKADSLETAVNGALDALERQVREEREKRGEPWKRPDLNPDQMPPLDSETE